MCRKNQHKTAPSQLEPGALRRRFRRNGGANLDTQPAEVNRKLLICEKISLSRLSEYCVSITQSAEI